jgi:ABC-type multidrug transport system fused ATPase/permease subunit
MRRALSFFRYKWALVLSVIFAIAQGGAPFLMNIIMSDMMNVMTEQASGDFVGFISDLCLKMLGVTCGMAALAGLSISCRCATNPIFMTDLRDATYRSLMELDIPFFDINPTGILVSRLSEDVTLVRETYIDKGLTINQSMARSVIGIILALCPVWRGTLVCLPAVPLAAVTYVVGEYFVERQWFKFNDQSMVNSAKAEEASLYSAVFITSRMFSRTRRVSMGLRTL